MLFKVLFLFLINITIFSSPTFAFEEFATTITENKGVLPIEFLFLGISLCSGLSVASLLCYINHAQARYSYLLQESDEIQYKIKDLYNNSMKIL